MYYFPCPNCENNAKFHNLHESSSEGTGCAILFFGGILSALIYEDSRRKRIQCAKCGLIFPRPSLPSSPVARMLFWLCVAIPLGGIGSFLLGYTEPVATWLKNNESVITLQKFVADNSLSVMLCIFSMLFLLFGISFIGAIVANVRFRSDFRKKYECEPTERSETDKQPEMTGS